MIWRANTQCDSNREYELLACVSIIQRRGCMRADEYRKYELVSCVSIIQREGCMHANE